MENSPPVPPVPPVQPSTARSSESNDKLLAMLCHLSYFFLSLIFPLIVYLAKKDESPFLTECAKEALNFHITIILASIVLLVTVVGIVLIPVVAFGGLILTILATIRTNDGLVYRYPICLRLVR